MQVPGKLSVFGGCSSLASWLARQYVPFFLASIVYSKSTQEEMNSLGGIRCFIAPKWGQGRGSRPIRESRAWVAVFIMIFKYRHCNMHSVFGCTEKVPCRLRSHTSSLRLSERAYANVAYGSIGSIRLASRSDLANRDIVAALSSPTMKGSSRYAALANPASTRDGRSPSSFATLVAMSAANPAQNESPAPLAFTLRRFVS